MKRKRFGLIYLDPGEVSLDVVSVNHIISEDRLIDELDYEDCKGKLRICSKSLIFESEDRSMKLIRISYVDIDDMECQVEDKLIRVRCGKCRYDENDTMIRPFHIVNSQQTHIFRLMYTTDQLIFQLVQQFHKATTLPKELEVEQMRETLVESRLGLFHFQSSCLHDPLNERMEYNIISYLIEPLTIEPIRFIQTTENIYLQRLEEANTHNFDVIDLDRIVGVYDHLFNFMSVAIEIFHMNKSNEINSVLIRFSSTSYRDKWDSLSIYRSLKNRITFNRPLRRLAGQQNNLFKYENLEEAKNSWLNGQLDNYNYLLILNHESGRSFNDLTQYPVMPWIIQDYTSSHLNMDDESIYRDLSKPVGALNPERYLRYLLRFEQIQEDNERFFYGSFYSTPGIVLFYLFRQCPQLTRCYHDGRFDQPDRIFHSIEETWRNVLNNDSDVKELIPQFFDDSRSDFLKKNNKIIIGKRSDGSEIDNVILPKWAKSPEHFIQTNRAALESDFISHKLPMWIDLIFGCAQNGNEAINSRNLFYPTCYANYVNKLMSDSSPQDIQQKRFCNNVAELGQCPKQLFHQRHEKRSTKVEESKEMNSLEELLEKI
ncbi:hypothetical protein SNEBB_007472 [Seison nebaliae]|nr:hypothetical protein SNEBB_007472 [Seison nebaliae]